MKHPALLTLSGVALVLGLVAAPVVSTAQPAPAPTMVPVVKPDFSSMMFLTGTWNCTQMLRGKTRPDTSTTTIGMDGMWMVTQDTAPPFDQYRTVTINSTNYTTYDPTIKQWVSVGVDTGGGYGISSTPGWIGNTMTSMGKGLDGSTFNDVHHQSQRYQDGRCQHRDRPQGKMTKTTITCKKSS